MMTQFELLKQEFESLLTIVDQYAVNPDSKACEGLLHSAALRYSFSVGEKVKLQRDIKVEQDTALEGSEFEITRIVDADRPYSIYNDIHGGIWVYSWEIL